MSDSSNAAVARMVTALTDSDRLYESAQVAFLMATAQRWGYETRAAEETVPDPLSHAAGYEQGYRDRVAEENAGYPAAPYAITTGIRIGADQGAARAAADADRTEHYRGGPVDDWGPSAPDHVPDLRVSTRVNIRSGVCTWADE